MNAALGRHIDYYNNRRRHRSFGMRTPAELAMVTADAMHAQRGRAKTSASSSTLAAGDQSARATRKPMWKVRKLA